MSAYYNEIDPYAAQWLRNLIAAGHIAPGEVDERSISDVKPDDLRPFTQCHFFAGLGGWSAALRRAGWSDDRRVWTASCPCQPFSQAGAGAGMDDERHLWPDFYWLAMQLDPGEILGEQVASKDAEPWLDLVQADMEAVGYAFGAISFPSAGIGAPHIRDRTYWVAHAMRPRLFPGSLSGIYRGEESPGSRDGEPERPGAIGGMGYASGAGLGKRFSNAGISSGACGADAREATQRAGIYLGGMADACSSRSSQQLRSRDERVETFGPGFAPMCGIDSPGRAGPVNGLWADADWLFCRDGKWRPVEPGTFPLADGASARVGRLRAYGNAINVEAAAQFIAAYMEVAP